MTSIIVLIATYLQTAAYAQAGWLCQANCVYADQPNHIVQGLGLAQGQNPKSRQRAFRNLFNDCVELRRDVMGLTDSDAQDQANVYLAEDLNFDDDQSYSGSGGSGWVLGYDGYVFAESFGSYYQKNKLKLCLKFATPKSACVQTDDLPPRREPQYHGPGDARG